MEDTIFYAEANKGGYHTIRNILIHFSIRLWYGEMPTGPLACRGLDVGKFRSKWDHPCSMFHVADHGWAKGKVHPSSPTVARFRVVSVSRCWNPHNVVNFRGPLSCSSQSVSQLFLVKLGPYLWARTLKPHDCNDSIRSWHRSPRPGGL